MVGEPRNLQFRSRKIPFQRERHGPHLYDAAMELYSGRLSALFAAATILLRGIK